MAGYRIRTTVELVEDGRVRKSRRTFRTRQPEEFGDCIGFGAAMVHIDRLGRWNDYYQGLHPVDGVTVLAVEIEVTQDVEEDDGRTTTTREFHRYPMPEGCIGSPGFRLAREHLHDQAFLGIRAA